MSLLLEVPQILLLLAPAGAKQSELVAQWLTDAEGITTLASKQKMGQDHLSLAENVRLAASCYGGAALSRQARMLQLAEAMGLNSRQLLNQMSLSDRRLVSLLLAFLPKPTLVVVDDLTNGLSIPAGQLLWSFLSQLWQQEGCRLVYISTDLQAITYLPAGQVWLVGDNDCGQCWPFDHLPPLLRSPCHYVFEFGTIAAAEAFVGKVQSDPAGIICHRLESKCVQLFSNDQNSLVDLTLMAGPKLERFQTRPVTLLDLPDQLVGVMEPMPRPIRAETRQAAPGRGRVSAIVQIALSEWRWHFRQFWKGGNLILAAVWFLSFLSLMVENGPNVWLMSSVLSWAGTIMLVWSSPAGHRHLVAAEKYMSAPILWLGFGLGQLALILVHSGLFWLGWLALFPRPEIFLLSFGFWLLLTACSLPLAILIGGAAKNSGRATLAGGLLFLVCLFSGPGLSRLPAEWLPLGWFWPVTAFTLAFRQIVEANDGFIPLFFGLAGLAVLWLLAWRSVGRRSLSYY